MNFGQTGWSSVKGMHTQMVMGPSGRHMGRVQEVEEDRFLLNFDGGLVWLRDDMIFTADANYITLICEEAGIRRYCR